MCRLFGLHAGTPVDAEFWLIDAPDSLAAQSHLLDPFHPGAVGLRVAPQAAGRGTGRDDRPIRW